LPLSWQRLARSRLVNVRDQLLAANRGWGVGPTVTSRARIAPTSTCTTFRWRVAVFQAMRAQCRTAPSRRAKTRATRYVCRSNDNVVGLIAFPTPFCRARSQLLQRARQPKLPTSPPFNQPASPCLDQPAAFAAGCTVRWQALLRAAFFAEVRSRRLTLDVHEPPLRVVVCGGVWCGWVSSNVKIGQGEITGDTCYSVGLVAQQAWEIDTSQNPQVFTITFSGGQDGRQSILTVTCDPHGGDPVFTVKGETRTMVYEVDVTSKFACGGPIPPPSPPPPPPPPSPPNPPPSPPSPPNPPTPSPPNPPSPRFRCMSNTCTRLPANSTASGYDTLAQCEKGCGPPFWCVDP
jgi:hypothetical protein